MSGMYWPFKPENWDSLTAEEKVRDILRRMELIVKYVHRRDMRSRFASTEQFLEEYPPEHETTLAIAFIRMKEEIDLVLARTLELTKDEILYLEILEKHIDEDIDRELLEGVECDD